MEKGKLTENGSENTGRGMRRKESSGDGKEGESIRKNGWKRKKVRREKRNERDKEENKEKERLQRRKREKY